MLRQGRLRGHSLKPPNSHGGRRRAHLPTARIFLRARAHRRAFSGRPDQRDGGLQPADRWGRLRARHHVLQQRRAAVADVQTCAHPPAPPQNGEPKKNGIVCGKMCWREVARWGTWRDSGGRRGKGGGRSSGPPVPRRCTWQGSQASSGTWRASWGRRGKGGGMSFVPPVPRCCTWQGLEPVLGARSVRAASLTFAAHRAQDRGSTRARC